MAVLRSARTVPLSLTANALNNNSVSGYDWPGDTSGSNAGDGADFIGSALWSKTGTIPLVTGIALPEGGTCQARDVSNGLAALSYYELSGGLYTILGAVGTGDLSFWMRVRTPSVNSFDNASYRFARLTTAAGAYLELSWYRISASSSYNLYVTELNGGTSVIQNWPGSINLPINKIVDIYVTRVSGTWNVYMSAAGFTSTKVSFSVTPAAIAIGAGTAYFGQAFGGAVNLDTLLIDSIFWTRGLSDADVAAHSANPYNYYTHVTNPDVIAVTSPINGATVGTNIAITGTYGGDNAPSTGIEASFNGGAYQTIVASPSGGTFSGSLTGQTSGTGTLTVRWKNNTAISATVTSLTVTTNAIAITSPTLGKFYPVSPQTTGSASITVAGTYSGTPTTIEYRWNGGSWTTLVASPSGGTFSQAISVGMGQVVEVRFSNATSVTATAIVGAGDVFYTSGQSNNVGQASNYIPPVAPGAKPLWIGYEYGKTGAYRQLVETAGNNAYSSTVGAQFAVWSGETGLGSWAGKCSSLLMAQGIVVCFVPVAKGSTTSANWLMDTGTPTNTGTLFGAALTTKNQVGAIKGLIHWQGEADVATPTTWTTNTNSIINNWFTQAGSKTLLVAICKSSFTDPTYSAFHTAQVNLASSNTNVAGLADMENAWNSGGVHYDGTSEINAVATIMANAIMASFYSFKAVLPALKDQTGTLVANTTFKWQWFDQVVAPFSAPVVSGNFTTDASGVPPQLNLPGTTLIAGQYGTVQASTLLADRSNLSTAIQFCYPQVVS